MGASVFKRVDLPEKVIIFLCVCVYGGKRGGWLLSWLIINLHLLVSDPSYHSLPLNGGLDVVILF